MVEAERFSDSASIMETLFMALQQRKRENISVVGVVIRVTVERAKNRTEQREREGEGITSLSGEQGKGTDSR